MKGGGEVNTAGGPKHLLRKATNSGVVLALIMYLDVHLSHEEALCCHRWNLNVTT